jgi:DNA adenine methylase
LVSKYVPLFPEHTAYVEPFGGSGTVLLSKPRAKIEVYNDLEEGVYSLHACLRDEHLSSLLMRQLKLTPYSRQEHANCIATYNDSTSLVEKARKWFVATQASYGSILGETFNTSPNKSRAVEWDRKIDRFEPVIERMRGVTVENRDFETVLRKWNGPETFNFIDPPHVHGSR